MSSSSSSTSSSNSSISSSSSSISGGQISADLMYCSSYIQGQNPNVNATSKSPTEIYTTLFARVENESSRLTPFDRVLAARTFKALAETGKHPVSSNTLNKLFKEVFSTEDPTTLSAEQLRSYLVEHGILPSAAEAKATFWALGEDLLKQSIRENLHAPAYLEGLEKAGRYFTEHFDQPLSPDLYQQIHASLGLHEGDVKSGLRSRPLQVVFDDRLSYPQDLENIKELSKLIMQANYLLGSVSAATSRFRLTQTKSSLEETEHQKSEGKENLINDLVEIFGDESFRTKTPAEISMALEEKKFELLTNIKEIKEKGIEAARQETERLAKRLSLGSSLIEFDILEGGLLMNCNDVVDLESVTKKLIEEFNRDLTVLQRKTVDDIQGLKSKDREQQLTSLVEIQKIYQEEAVKLIARLYAGMEWVHPWFDGQVRTDLIMLNGLLCREGLHPCILDNPRFSILNTVDNWTKYLKEGLTQYEKLRIA